MYSPLYYRIIKHHVLRHEETNGKYYNKGYKQRRHVRLEGIKTKMQILFLQQIRETYKIQKETQKGIPRASSCIPKGLDIHQPPKRRIKKINDRED